MTTVRPADVVSALLGTVTMATDDLAEGDGEAKPGGNVVGELLPGCPNVVGEYEGG